MLYSCISDRFLDFQDGSLDLSPRLFICDAMGAAKRVSEALDVGNFVISSLFSASRSF